MNINELPIVQEALENEYRIAIYKQNNCAYTNALGPYRITIMPFPMTADSQQITASGETLEDAIRDLSTGSPEMLKRNFNE